jgi:hypothetical protein
MDTQDCACGVEETLYSTLPHTLPHIVLPTAAQTCDVNPSKIAPPKSLPCLYRPLEAGEIRVLRVHPVAHGGPIRCSMKHIQLNHARRISYEALSYEWGLPDDDRNAIWIFNQRVGVRKNLFEALRRIRIKSNNASNIITLWVDAVCINQEDVEERNAQVSMMRTIYSCATSVVVWLGPTYENSDEAFEYIDHALESKTWITNGARPVDRGWLGLVMLHNRSYWTRLWIIQEFVLAKRIILRCGGKQVDWDAFLLARDTILGHFESHFGPQKRLRQSSAFVLNRLRDTESERTLEDLLAISYASRCQRRQDKIFGLLGLLPPPNVEPVYILKPTRFTGQEPGLNMDYVETLHTYYEATERVRTQGTTSHSLPPVVDYDLGIFGLYYEVLRYHARYLRKNRGESIIWDNAYLRQGDPVHLVHFSQLLQHALGNEPNSYPFPPHYALTSNIDSEFCFQAAATLGNRIEELGPYITGGRWKQGANKWLRDTCKRGLVSGWLKQMESVLDNLTDADVDRIRAVTELPGTVQCHVSVPSWSDEYEKWKQQTTLYRSRLGHRIRKGEPLDGYPSVLYAPRLSRLLDGTLALVPWTAEHGDVICALVDPTSRTECEGRAFSVSVRMASTVQKAGGTMTTRTSDSSEAGGI